MPLLSLVSMGRNTSAVQAQRSPGNSGRCVQCRPPVFMASHSLSEQVSMPDTCTQGEQCYLQAAGSDDAAATAKLSIVTPTFDARAIPTQSPFKVHSPHSLLHISRRSRPHTPEASRGHPDFALCSHGRLSVPPGRTEPRAQHWQSSSSRGSTPRSEAGQVRTRVKQGSGLLDCSIVLGTLLTFKVMQGLGQRDEIIQVSCAACSTGIQ